MVAGGRGFGTTDEWARRLGADAWLSNPRLLDGLLGRWEPDIEASEAATVDLVEAKLTERYADIGAIAEAVGAAHSLSGSQLAATRLDVSMFVETLDAAALITDPVPFVELADWHRQYVESGARPATTASILGELAARFAGVDHRVGAIVAAAAEGMGAPTA